MRPCTLLWPVVAAIWLVGCGDDSGSASVGESEGASSSSSAASTGSGGEEGSSSGATTGGATTGAETTGGATTGGESTGGESTGGETTGEETTGEETTGGDAMDMCPRVKVMVAPGQTLNVRPDPSTQGAPVGSLPNHTIVDVLAIVHGEAIGGVDTWYEIASGGIEGFVFAGFVACTLEEAPELLPPDGYFLPLTCGSSATISQGNFGGFSHQGKAAYAFDFAIGVGTPLVAMADGVVIHVFDQTGPGDPCYNGGGQECFPYANLVVLRHGDGAASIYKHLSAVGVALGEFVPRGASVGASGSTGYSTGRHAHVMRTEDCGVANCQSIPLSFVDVAGGVPKTNQKVTSGNCP